MLSCIGFFQHFGFLGGLNPYFPLITVLSWNHICCLYSFIFHSINCWFLRSSYSLWQVIFITAYIEFSACFFTTTKIRHLLGHQTDNFFRLLCVNLWQPAEKAVLMHLWVPFFVLERRQTFQLQVPDVGTCRRKYIVTLLLYINIKDSFSTMIIIIAIMSLELKQTTLRS